MTSAAPKSLVLRFFHSCPTHPPDSPPPPPRTIFHALGILFYSSAKKLGFFKLLLKHLSRSINLACLGIL